MSPLAISANFPLFWTERALRDAVTQRTITTIHKYPCGGDYRAAYGDDENANKPGSIV